MVSVLLFSRRASGSEEEEEDDDGVGAAVVVKVMRRSRVRVRVMRKRLGAEEKRILRLRREISGKKRVGAIKEGGCV